MDSDDRDRRKGNESVAVSGKLPPDVASDLFDLVEQLGAIEPRFKATRQDTGLKHKRVNGNTNAVLIEVLRAGIPVVRRKFLEPSDEQQLLGLATGLAAVAAFVRGPEMRERRDKFLFLEAQGIPPFGPAEAYRRRLISRDELITRFRAGAVTRAELHSAFGFESGRPAGAAGSASPEIEGEVVEDADGKPDADSSRE
jgi:hypothetical protein